MGLCLGLCLAVSAILGLLPAIRLSRPNLVPALKDDVAGGGWRVGRIHRAAAAVQVAIAVPFLVVSGVMLDRVRTADFGFDPEGLVAVRFDPTKMAATDRGAISIQTILDALGRLQTIPKAKITVRRDSDLSLMPDGLHLGLTLEEFADLVAYLESLKPVAPEAK